MYRIGLIGAGSWGCALAYLLSENGHEVEMWTPVSDELDMLTRYHENKDKLPGVKLPDTVTFTDDLEHACSVKNMLVIAVPSTVIRQTARRMRDFVKPGQLAVVVTKGIEEHTNRFMSEIVEEEIPGINAAILSGPSHAEEVGRGLPTAVVTGAHDQETAKEVQEVFMSPVFRVYTSSDMRGIQLGAALKNVMALAAGMADGLGNGDNTKAAIITRGSAELARLGEKMGIDSRTVYGLSGIGDLIVTCASRHSRNRMAGMLIGQGYSAEEAMKKVHQIVEGVHSARAAKELAEKYDVRMPIVEAVNEILFEGKPAAEAVDELMQRVGKNELGSW